MLLLRLADDLTAAQAAELDFRTSFAGADGLPDLDSALQHDAAQDGVEFARMLLAQDEQEQKAAAEARETAAAVAAALQMPDDEDEDVENHHHHHHHDVLTAAEQDDVDQHGSESVDTDAAADLGEIALNAKDRCRYYGKNRARCPRAATGLDGRCALHKFSQFCRQPRCNKFNQGNGYCIKHGGGKKCKQDGCLKQVQGYGYCSGHGGKPLCPIEGCENKRMEGGYVVFCFPPLGSSWFC